VTVRTAHSAAAPSSSEFPGFGEAAPLDLSGLTDAQVAGIASRFADRTLTAFTDTVAAVGNCSNPVRLVGSSETYDTATGEQVGRFDSDGLPLGVLYRPCGNRRADICPSCSRTYARDQFAMIKAGLVGGKTVPESVADNPLLFVTFTAPSFGHVHGARTRKDGRPARCRPRDTSKVCQHGRSIGCMRTHEPGDAIIGAPICEDCYDWYSAVVWQWWAPELWRRTTIGLRRTLARTLGVTETKRQPTKKRPIPPPCLADVASVQFAKVAEYQDRGLIHFHALIRLDGPSGAGSPSPLDGATLGRLVEDTAHGVEFHAPPVDDDDRARMLAWGQQLDIRVVRQGNRTDHPDGPLAPEQVAGYLAKYSTKDANSLRSNDQPRPHLLRLRATVNELAARARLQAQCEGPAGEKPYDLLGKWAHMYGFRGHFGSKSRRYSVTLGQLRRARQRFAEMVARGENPAALDVRDLEERLLADDEDETTLVVGSWTYQGSGWTRPGDEALALAAAARAREYDQWRAEQRRTA
jgi:hypothetical protein